MLSRLVVAVIATARDGQDQERGRRCPEPVGRINRAGGDGPPTSAAARAKAGPRAAGRAAIGEGER